MNPNSLAALIVKDVRLFFKNRFFALVAVLGLVFYIAFFYLLPNEVDETLEMGWHGPPVLGEFIEEQETEGLVLSIYPTEADLRQAVLDGEQMVGIHLGEDFIPSLRQGQRPAVVVYLRSDVPEEYREVYSFLMEEIAYVLVGQAINLEVDEVILGPDMAGQQVPPRQRLLPLLATFLVMVETWGLAALIAAEAESGTLRALLVTPLTVGGLFLSKGITGVVMTFLQVFLLVALTGGLRQEPGLVLAILLLGSLLVTGLSFLIGSVSRGMMSVMAWGMLVMVILAIPAFNILLPGLASGWIKIIPSYYLVDSLYRVINFGAGWSELAPNLLALLGFSGAFFVLGVASFLRRLQ
jgi:ABC-2 type transport system permease protein